jgi:hypothetical protein
MLDGGIGVAKRLGQAGRNRRAASRSRSSLHPRLRGATQSQELRGGGSQPVREAKHLLYL